MGLTKKKIFNTLYKTLKESPLKLDTKTKSSTTDALFELNEILTGKILNEKRVDVMRFKN